MYKRQIEYCNKEAGQEVPISVALSSSSDIPTPVLSLAEDFVAQRIALYQANWPDLSPSCSITEAKITGLTPISTGAVDLNGGMAMYRLEYRLRVEGNIEEVIAGGANYETIDGDTWMTEWTSAGQPYLLFHYNDYNDMDNAFSWQPICTFTDDDLTQFSSSEMLQKYGDRYTAAAMELYTQYLEANQQ